MSLKDNLAVSERIMAAFFSGDSETVHALIADDFVLHPPRGSAHYDLYEGSSGFIRFIEKFGAVYDLTRSVRANRYASEEGDVIVFELHLTGTVRASGNAFDTTLLEAWHFRDGQLVLIRPHWFEIPA